MFYIIVYTNKHIMILRKDEELIKLLSCNGIKKKSVVEWHGIIHHLMMKMIMLIIY